MRISFSLGVSKSYDYGSSICLGLLIGYLFLITLITFAAWQPFLIYWNNVDAKSKRVLAILPLDLILKIHHIFKYLEEQTFEIQGAIHM